MGWIDHKYNKRDTRGDIWEGAYRAEAPALGISLKYEF